MFRSVRRLDPVLIFLVVLASASWSWGSQAKISPELGQVHGNGFVTVIVQYEKPGLKSSQQRVVAHGGTLQSEVPLVGGTVVQVPAQSLSELAKDPNVRYISPDHPLGTSLNNATAAALANYAWQMGLDGTGIGVAVVDSGVHVMDDLKDASGKSRIRYTADMLGGNGDDAYGHGTHIAGIIGGNAKYSSCGSCDVAIRGVAPNVNLINIRALDKNGQGTDSSVINAIQTAVQLKAQYNIRVLNLSLGRPVFDSYLNDPLCQAVEKAWNAGIVVVVAAGNEGRNNSVGTSGYGTIGAPGNDPYVITVGAMNTKGTADRADDVMASYSSKGPTAIDHIVKPDIVAAGNRVVSLEQGYLKTAFPSNHVLNSYYMNTPSTALSDKYMMLSGTSMATGVVSGAVALLLENDPTLTPDQVKAILMRSAYKTFPRYTTVVDGANTYNIQYDVFTVGAGYLDIQAALSTTERPLGVAKSPTAVYDGTSGAVYFLNDNSAVWGNSAMWGNSGMWGASAMWGSSIFLSGNTALWGNSGIWGSSAIWGNSAMWGTSTNSGFSALWSNTALWGAASTTSDALSTTINGEN